MFLIPDEIRSPVLDHLRVTEKMLRLIEQLSHGAASCDHRLVQSYALQALSRLQAAEQILNERSPRAGGPR
jgi:hypothetical protein